MPESFPDNKPCVPVVDLEKFVQEQFVVAEAQHTIAEAELAGGSQIRSGMYISYLAGQLAMLNTLSDFIGGR